MINCARSALAAFGIMLNGVTVGCNATIIILLTINSFLHTNEI
jgi:hypothetical protein